MWLGHVLLRHESLLHHYSMILSREEWRGRSQEVGKECTCWATWWKTKVTWKSNERLRTEQAGKLECRRSAGNCSRRLDSSVPGYHVINIEHVYINTCCYVLMCLPALHRRWECHLQVVPAAFSWAIQSRITTRASFNLAMPCLRCVTRRRHCALRSVVDQ